MVEVALHVAPVAFYVGLLIVVTFGKCVFAVAHAVGLYVGFCHHIYTIAVAEGVPVVVVGIVAGAHSVEVELLHYLYVLQHAFARHYITSVGVKLVTVCSLYEDRLSVDKQL